MQGNNLCLSLVVACPGTCCPRPALNGCNRRLWEWALAWGSAQDHGRDWGKGWWLELQVCCSACSGQHGRNSSQKHESGGSRWFGHKEEWLWLAADLLKGQGQWRLRPYIWNENNAPQTPSARAWLSCLRFLFLPRFNTFFPHPISFHLSL